jgi:hypothetical protein
MNAISVINRKMDKCCMTVERGVFQERPQMLMKEMVRGARNG